ncbi:MAG: AraC family transcriptional regulator [Armatimonadetes bacterium]|nr:AraC family transcriptional regulator [Armatimonadota bacterium]
MSDHNLLNIPLHIPTSARDAALVTSVNAFVRHNLPDMRHRLIFVREGILHVQIAQTTYALTQDQVLIIKASNAFVRTHPADSLLRYYALRFSIDDSLISRGLGLDIPIMTTLARPDLVEKLFLMLLDEQSDGLVQDRFAQMLFVQILSEVADGELRKAAAPTCCVPLVEHAKAHIRAHYDRQISTTTVAKSIDCSPGYLSRAFHASTGGTLTDFIHEVRMFRARLLLTETNKPITQIAHECGFENPSYFQRLFNKYEGMPPGSYRKQHSRIYTITIE